MEKIFMETKTILVNGKPEVAYAIFKTGEIPCDYSYLMKMAADTVKRDVFSIYFKPNWAFTFPLYNQPTGTALTLDNIARIDYKLRTKFLKRSGDPKLKQQEFERLKHADPPQFIYDNILEWSLITLLLPREKTTKESVEVVELPDGSKVNVKVPKGKTLAFENHFEGAPSPIKILTIDEQATVERLMASKRNTTDIAKTYKALVKKAVREELRPIAKTFEKAILLSTPPQDQKWWQNLRAAYTRESGPTNSARWHAVAHKIVLVVNEDIKTNVSCRHDDYLTSRMLKTLISKLNAPGANLVQIETAYADTLRRYVTREEQKFKKAAKARA